MHRKQLAWTVLASIAAVAIAASLLWPRASSSGAPQALAPAAQAPAPPELEPAPERLDVQVGASAARAEGAPEERPASAPAPEPIASAPSSGVYGTVRDAEGAPVAGVRVEALIELAGTRRPLGVGTTDAHGMYFIDCPLQAEVHRLAQRLELDTQRQRPRRRDSGAGSSDAEPSSRPMSTLRPSRARALLLAVEAGRAGHGWARTTRQLAGDAPPASRVDLCLCEAARLSGVVHHRGTPVPGARVQLFDGDWALRGEAACDAEGRYRLGLPEPGRFVVHARAIGLGASANEGFGLGRALDFPEIDLDIDGLGTLAGQVKLPDGEPIGGLRVQALQYGLMQSERFTGRGTDPATIAQAEASGGLCASEAITDAEGNFRMTGLQEGAFALRVHGLRDEGLQPQGVYTTGPGAHELVLDLWFLLVELQDSSGWGFEEADLRQLEILCQPLDPDPEGAYRFGVLAHSMVAQASAAFVVEPGQRYRVSALAPWGSAQRELQIHAHPRVQRTLLRLGKLDPEVLEEVRAFEPLPPAVLELQLSDEAGEAVQGYELRLLRLADGEVVSARGERLVGPLRLELPAGAYELEVIPPRAADAFLVGFEARGLQLEPGRTRKLAEVLRRGGRIELALPSAEELGLAGQGSSTSLASLLELHALGATAFLRRHGTGAQSWIPLEFELAGSRSEPTRSLPLGGTGRTRAFEPGRYLLELHVPSQEPSRIELELRAGVVHSMAPEVGGARVRASER